MHFGSQPDRFIRDLVAISTMPAIWLGAELHRIAESLAASVYTMVDPAFVYIALRDETGAGTAEVAQVDRHQTDPELARRLQAIVFDWVQGHDPEDVLSLKPEFGAGLRLVVYPLGLNAELGVLAAAFSKLEEPTAQQQLLMSVSATQGATAVNNSYLLQSVREQKAQLQRSQAHLDAIFTEAEVGMCELDGGLSFLRINNEFCRLLGRRREELLNLKMTEVLAAEDLQKYAEALEKVVTTGRPVSLDQRCLRPDGSVVWANSTLSLLVSPQPESSSILVVSVDLSERLRAEASAVRRLQRLQGLTEASLELSSAKDPCGLLGAIAEHARRIIGAHQAIVNLSASKNWAVSFSEKYADYRGYKPKPDRAGISALVSQFKRPFRMTQPELEAHPAWKALGRRAPEEPPMRGWLAVPLTGSANQNLGFIQLSDKHEGDFDEEDQSILVQLAQFGAMAIEKSAAEESLRDSQQQYEALVWTSAQIVWTTNSAGDFEESSATWCEYTGQSAADSLGRGWLRAIHPDDRETVARDWRGALEQGKPWSTEYRLRHRAGEWRWSVARAAPIFHADGSVRKWVGMNTDIQDRKEAEKSLQALLEQEQILRHEAETANRLKDEFLATVSHELRTPLNAILGWATLARQDSSNREMIERAIEVIERNARNQTLIVSDILDVSGMITGKLKLNLERFDIQDVLEAALDSVHPAVEAKGIRLTRHFEAACDKLIGDPDRLRQVFWNLLSNAVKFTPEGGQIEVCLRRQTGYAEVEVRDNGIGIPPDFLPFVFDRFRQADGKSNRKHGGLGLGLSIVRHILELHGGSASARSDGLSKGSCFTARLPLRWAADGAGSPPSLQPTSRDLARQLAGVHVLVVDDEADGRELTRVLFAAQGAHVLVASSAREALEIFKAQKVDVVVSDLGMQEQDGFFLIREIRTIDRDVPCLALTGFARPKDEKAVRQAGFQAYLSKPVDSKLLVDAVANLAARAAFPAITSATPAKEI